MLLTLATCYDEPVIGRNGHNPYDGCHPDKNCAAKKNTPLTVKFLHERLALFFSGNRSSRHYRPLLVLRPCCVELCRSLIRTISSLPLRSVHFCSRLCDFFFSLKMHTPCCRQWQFSPNACCIYSTALL